MIHLAADLELGEAPAEAPVEVGSRRLPLDLGCNDTSGDHPTRGVVEIGELHSDLLIDGHHLTGG